MLNYVFLGISAYFIIFGLLLGFKRGFKKSLLRLIFVAASLVGAVLLARLLAPKIVPMIINTISKFLNIPIEVEYKEIITGLLAVVLCMNLSIVLYLLLKLILLPIQNAIFKSKVRYRSFLSRLLGLILGTATGAISAIYICSTAILAISNVNKVDKALRNVDVSLNIPYEYYKEIEDLEKTKIYEIYSKFDIILDYNAKVEVDGKTYDFKSIVNSITSAIHIADRLEDMKNIDFSKGFTEDNKNYLVDLLKDLDKSKNEIDPTSMEAIQTFIDGALKDYTKDTTIDLEKINFSKAGDAVEKAYSVQEKKDKPESITDSEVDALVNDVIDSNIIHAASSLNLNLSLPTETKDQVKDILNSKTNLSQADKDKYLKLLNINN